MRNRFYLPTVFTPGNELELSGPEFHHAVMVARVRIGESIELFDGRGSAATASVQSIDADKAVLRLTDEVLSSREAGFRIELAMSLIQVDKFELVLQKGTELGAHRFIPLLADRSEIREERIRGKRQRWNKIIFEAVKQSGRSIIPELAEPQTLSAAIRPDALSIMFDPDESPSKIPAGASGATLLIGPEGGWSKEELETARLRGAIFRKLGTRRLRAETAAIAAMTAVGWQLGDLND